MIDLLFVLIELVMSLATELLVVMLLVVGGVLEYFTHFVEKITAVLKSQLARRQKTEH